MTDCNAPVRDGAGRSAAVPKQNEDLDLNQNRCVLTRERDGTPFRWRDREGLLHATVEWPLDPDAPESIGQTRCCRFNVPPGQSWSGREALTCSACAAIEAQEEAAAP